MSFAEVDVRDHEALVELLRGADACLNATVYYSNLEVMGACLEAGVHYTDLGGLFHTTRKQLELDEQFKAAGHQRRAGHGQRARHPQRPGPLRRRPAGHDRVRSASTTASSRRRPTTVSL